MATVFDVARYILEKCGPMTAMKLEKLVYYSQAWSLVWDDRPLFNERIEAWANGPVVPELFNIHRGIFTITPEMITDVKPSNLDQDALDTIDAVLSVYMDKPSHWLSELTHTEKPWKDARIGLAPGERGNNVITHGAMREYYESL